jgi:hypothetical protein
MAAWKTAVGSRIGVANKKSGKPPGFNANIGEIHCETNLHG